MVLLNNLYKTSTQTPNHLLHLTSQVNIVLGLVNQSEEESY